MDDLSWLSFHEEAKISKCLIAFKRLRGESFAYITCLLTYNSVPHSCNTGNANYNLVCPKLKHKLVGGKTLNVTVCQLWNIMTEDICTKF